ncbi:MAG: DUF4198 domain-containing protein [Maricaulaceae bacterium]
MIARFCRFAMLGLCALSGALPAGAHEMFLKPTRYQLEPGATAVIELVNGTFERSDNTIDRDRMRDVTVLGGGSTRHPTVDQWTDEGATTLLSHTIEAAGTYAIGVSTRPRIIALSVEAFTGYLKHDGVLDALAAFDAETSPDPVRERYSKHVRTIVQVGDTRSDDFAKALDYPVEIVLAENPTALDTGDRVAFQVLRSGEPVPGQLVYASYAGFEGEDGAGDHARAVQMRTDNTGRAAFELSRAGVWYLTLIHMEKLADDTDADYESNWATLTFEVD